MVFDAFSELFANADPCLTDFFRSSTVGAGGV
jgi:hypothetical protein